MQSFTMKIGDVPISVHHRYPYIREISQDYLTDEMHAFEVSATDEQIAYERTLTAESLSDQSYEATALHRQIVGQMLHHGYLLIHGAAIAVDGEAYIFLAKSGVGKSTHIRLWGKYLRERVTVVNGDKPMFSFIGDRLYVHGNPWRGKEQWGRNISLPVKAFCLLNRGAENEIHPAAPGEIITKLFGQTLVPKTSEDVALFMGMLDRIVREVPFYTLHCNMADEAAIVSYREMSKENTK